jgi:hypothetical protein
VISYTRFEKELLVATYILGEERSEDYTAIRDVIEQFQLDPRPNWIQRALQSYVDYGYSIDVRHIGQEMDQSVSLTGGGLREAERLIEEGIVPSRRQAETASDEPRSEMERLSNLLLPASDRYVTPQHNSEAFVDAVTKVEEAKQCIIQSNEIAPDERTDAVIHLDAGFSLLKNAKTVAIGAIRYLVLDRLRKAFEGAIEDVFKTVLVTAFIALAAYLLALL